MDGYKRLASYGLVACLTALSGIACSEWTPPLPTTPSALPSAIDSAPSSGATIQGRVSGASAGGSALVATLTSTSLTVKIVGTDISAPVSSSGSFVLESVPSGNIRLQFTNTTTNAIATLGSVAEGDRLDVNIRLSGSVGIIEASIRIKADNTTEVRGEVTATSGACPNLNFVVNGWMLKVDSSSQGGCADIKIGVKVKIKGNLTSTRVVVVVRIEASRPHDDRDDDSDTDTDS